jgi:hypothetical protein
VTASELLTRAGDVDLVGGVPVHDVPHFLAYLDEHEHAFRGLQQLRALAQFFRERRATAGALELEIHAKREALAHVVVEQAREQAEREQAAIAEKLDAARRDASKRIEMLDEMIRRRRDELASLNAEIEAGRRATRT